MTSLDSLAAKVPEVAKAQKDYDYWDKVGQYGHAVLYSQRRALTAVAEYVARLESDKVVFLESRDHWLRKYEQAEAERDALRTQVALHRQPRIITEIERENDALRAEVARLNYSLNLLIGMVRRGEEVPMPAVEYLARRYEEQRP